MRHMQLLPSVTGFYYLSTRSTAAGAEVSWVMAGELLNSTAGANTGAVPNTLRCTLSEVLPFGELCMCTLVPQQLPVWRLSLTCLALCCGNWRPRRRPCCTCGSRPLPCLLR